MSDMTVTRATARYLRPRSLRPSAERDDDPIQGLAPHPLELFATGLLLCFFIIAIAAPNGATPIINVGGPACLTIIVGLGAVRMTRRNLHAIWTPLFWYRLAMATYLGIGSVITSFLNADTRDLIEAFFAFFPRDLLKFNTVNALFHMSLLVWLTIIVRLYRFTKSSRSKVSIITACHIPLHFVGYVCLGIGMSVNYLIIYPSALQLISFSVPNFIWQLGQLAYMGYFLITYWALTNSNTRLVAVMIVLAGIDSIAGLLQLTKYAAIFPVMMIPIAYIYHKSSFRRIALSLVFLIPYYMLVSSVVYTARDNVERSGANKSATFADAVAVMEDMAQGRVANSDSGPDYQLAWARLSYVNAGTLAISLHDQGLTGDTLANIFVVWIPRVIYRDKPNITDIGRDFTFMANGNYDSSTTTSLPSEGYWDFGWAGVVLFSLLFCVVVTLLSIYATLVFERGAWHLLLVVMLGIRIGARIDGMMVPDIVGPLNAVVAIHIGCQLLNRFLPKMQLLQNGRR